MDHLAGQCTDALGDTCSAAWEVSFDTLYKSIRDGRNGNKNAMVPTRQGVLTAAAAENADAFSVDASAPAADDSAAARADASQGTVNPTAAGDTDDAARGAVKPTVDDDVDGLCRRACREHHHHSLRGLLEPRLRAPGR